MVIYGFLSAPVLFKVIRTQVMAIQTQEYMQAAELLGISKRSQVYQHILPNVISHVVVGMSLMLAQAILLELVLFFVGIGYMGGAHTLMKPTWGNLIPNIRGFNSFRSYYWLSVFPILNLVLVTGSLKLISEGVREAFDPKSHV